MKTIIICVFLLLSASTHISAQTEIRNSLNPCVREGGYGTAFTYSGKNKLFVLYISGGKGKEGAPEKYTAREYADLLQAVFKNPEYTNYPTEIVVFYKETNKARETLARVIMDGIRYETENGFSTFTPSTIGKYIDVLAKHYRDKEFIKANNKNN